MYQLWLDDLYPRAKFADALAIIEKVGHTKSMQMSRKDWINEGKPRRTTELDEDEVVPDRVDETPAEQEMDVVASVESSRPSGNIEHAMNGLSKAITAPTMGDDPDEDELDALLAEGAEAVSITPRTLPSRPSAAEHDPFADEMEAMADMEDMW